MAWPKGVKRGPRKPAADAFPDSVPQVDAAPPAQAAAQPTVRGPSIDRASPQFSPLPSANGRAVAVGRGGEQLSRRRTISSDQFYINPEWVPQDWDWQWNVYEVLGQPQTASRIGMAENGWRPVTADRLPGLFMPEGYSGPIIRDGLILEERPMALTLEAKREEGMKASKLVSDQMEQLMLSKRGALGDGFSDDSKYRGVGPVARTTIAPAPDAPRPRLPIDPSA